MLRNSTSTSYRLTLKVQEIKKEYREKERPTLYEHQYVTWKMFEFLTNSKEYYFRNQKGVLAYHETGAGKTMMFSAIASVSRLKVIIMMPKSLEENARTNVIRYCKSEHLNYKAVLARISFVSLNAGNMIKQIFDASLGSLNNMLLIIDEAHNFFRQITNGSKNGLGLYSMIMKAPRVKLLFSTGTPVNKNPFELVPCLNMLVGEDLFPSSYDEFHKFYLSSTLDPIGAIKTPKRITGGVDQMISNAELAELRKTYGGEDADDITTPIIEIEAITDDAMDDMPDDTLDDIPEDKPKDTIGEPKRNYITEMFSKFPTPEIKFVEPERLGKFMNRITGLISYVGPKHVKYPEVRSLILELVPMEIDQYGAYIRARDKESRELSYGTKSGTPMVMRSKSSQSTYRQKSRAISNVYEGVSPKAEKLVENLKKYPNQKGMTYSQFKDNGIFTVQKYMLLDGWIELTPDDVKMRLGGDFSTHKSGERYFAVIHGGMKQEDRTNVKNLYNKKENIFGEYVMHILFTSSGAEGMSLQEGTHGHIFEPYFNYQRIHQAGARIIRNHSHDRLPESQQYVQLYIYLADHNTPKPDPTTDVELYTQSIIRQTEINLFLSGLKRSSFDCTGDDCHVCTPTDIELFDTNFYSDLKKPDPCTKYKTGRVSVKTIAYDGMEYKYRKASSEESIYSHIIYSSDPILKKWIEINNSIPLFHILLDLIELAE